MRGLLSRAVPPIGRLLLVESGPRADARKLVAKLRAEVCGEAPVDLFTCLPDAMEELGPGARAWRSYEAGTGSERWRMLRDVRRQGHEAVAVLCVGSPLLAGWKIVLMALLPAKVLLVDEREGLFWLDRAHWREAGRLALARSGVGSPAFLRKLAHVVILPFGLCLLLAFAAKVHLGRAIRSMGPAGRSGSAG